MTQPLARRLLVALSAVLSVALAPVLVGLPGAHAAAPTPTATALAASPAYAGESTTLEVTLTAVDGTPLPGRPVTVDRLVDGTWAPLATLTTGPSGTAVQTAWLSRNPERNVFRARHAGDEAHAASRSAEMTAPLLRRATRVTLDGPGRIVDESSVALTTRWQTTEGDPVGGGVRIFRRTPGGSWSHVRTVRTGADGVVSFRIKPRIDTLWTAKGPALAWATGDRSGDHAVDNVPRMSPVQLPAGAPRPRVSLPKQPRAVRSGPHVVVSRIPDGVWRQMVGRSWHRGCPVGRSGLRLVRANYWAFDGYRRRGELVVNASAVPQFVRALRAQHRLRLPVRSMYRVDRFGWSSRLQGADDYRSMAADNTSAFNCRSVVGRPGVRSPHSWGRSFDINPWENPYRSSDGWVPNSWWVSRSHPQVAWRSRSHLRVRTLADSGFAWTYGVDDAHHFDARTSSGRVLLRGTCDAAVCD